MAAPAGRATGQGPSGQVRLGDMTSPELAGVLGSGPIDVLLPLGSFEQHGPHLPLTTDTLIAEAVAHEVAQALEGSILVAPCLPWGVSPYHLGFAGTASASREAVTGMVQAAVADWIGAGFRFAFLYSGHGGNLEALQAALSALPGEAAARAFVVNDWARQREAIHHLAASKLGLDPDRVGSHAGHSETSIVLHLAPDLVRMSRAEQGFIGDNRAAVDRMVSQGVQSLGPLGVIGDPTTATAEAGALYLALLRDLAIDEIERRRGSCRDNQPA
jgi:creatinine amidohydrolase